MPDSLTTVVNTGVETLNLIMPQIIGGLIIPVVGALKKYTSFVGTVVPGEFVQSLLAVIATLILTTFIPTDMTFHEIIKFGLEMVGTTTILYGGVKMAKKKGNQ